ncbi:MAG: hypothetical protein NT019_01180 [Candidatus Adlerbacteria bacterium]|nr:hypothetical protein [Candidatus Adlerbacteria bacterium]
MPAAYSPELAELFGILLGDGSVETYFTKVYLNRVVDKPYVSFVFKLCKRLFPKASVTRYDRPAKGVVEVQISSKAVSDYLFSIGFKPKERTVPAWISSNVPFTKRTLRGLFDTEGSVSFKFYRGALGDTFYRQLTCTNSNKNILSFLEKKLTLLGFKPTKNSRKNIYISNRLDIKKFLDDIGSSNPKILRKLRAKNLTEFRQKVIVQKGNI